MIKTTDLSREEQSLLLYLETCVVDNSCFIDTRYINEEDLEILKKFQDNDLIKFGRYSKKDVVTEMYSLGYWVYLSNEAFALAHQLRKERALRAYDRILVANGFIEKRDMYF